MPGVSRFLTSCLLLQISYAVNKQPLFDWYKGLEADNVVIAINCGAEEDTVDMGGIKFQKDKNFQGGVMSSEGGNQRWVMPNTEVYHTERWSDSDFSYQVPMDKNEDAEYVLILKFSEQYFDESGGKVFDVSIGDTTVIKNLDIWQRVGARWLPHDEFVSLKTERGDLFINGKKVNKAITNNKLTINFLKGKADNPKINALVLVKGQLKDTHHKSHEAYKQTLIDIQQEKALARAQAEQLF